METQRWTNSASYRTGRGSFALLDWNRVGGFSSPLSIFNHFQLLLPSTSFCTVVIQRLLWIT